MSPDSGEFPRKLRLDARRDVREVDEVDLALSEGQQRAWPPGGYLDRREAVLLRRRLRETAGKKGGRLKTVIVRLRGGHYQVVFQREDAK